MRPAAAVAAALLVATATASTSAIARPSIWDAARDPRTRQADFVLRAVERKLIQAGESGRFDPAAGGRITRAAIAMLQLARGRDLPDVRLRFLLGTLLVDSSVRRFDDARVVLESALADAPDSPLAGEAWFNLGIAYASIDQPKKEIVAYGHALERSWSRNTRATLFMNRGEAWMHLFKLDLAIADFRQALRNADSPDTAALAEYDLGVGLERNGDLPSALDAVARGAAVRMTSAFGSRSILEASSVFFVPGYEFDYYRALEAMALARRAKPPQAILLYQRARQDFGRYAALAAADNPPWLSHAALLAETCRGKIDELKRKRTRARPR